MPAMNKLGCPNNWLRAGHKCYKFNTGASHTWQESSDACHRTNSRLLQITTKDQKVNQTMIDHKDLHLYSACCHHFFHSAGLLVTSWACPSLGAQTSEGSREGKVNTNTPSFAWVDSQAVVYLEAAVAYPRLTTRGTSKHDVNLHEYTYC